MRWEFDSLHGDQYFWADGIIGNTVALQVTVGGSIPPRSTKFFALLVKWYNNCFVISNWQFDSVVGHQMSQSMEVVIRLVS